MITKITIKNLRQIKEETIDLASSVVFVGPNNSGKTTILQAVSLLGVAIRKWAEERVNTKSKAKLRVGVGITIDELFSIPVVSVDHVWRDMKIRVGKRNEKNKLVTANIQIEIHAEGIINDKVWKVGFEFDYARNNLIYARLTNDPHTHKPYEFPKVILDERIGYLPSLSGLSMVEDKLELGSINRFIGTGKTSDILRNICYRLHQESLDKNQKLIPDSRWNDFAKVMHEQFRIKTNPPKYNLVNGTLTMTYNEGTNKNLDLSDLGSGAKQVLLLFSYIYSFENSIILLDEPDAHLEVIKQENIYDKISQLVKSRNSQLIIASHSESVLKSAFSKDQVISSVLGKYKTENKKEELVKALTKIGYEQFLLANQTKKVLYLEGSTDLDFLRGFAQKLNHKAIAVLNKEFLFYPVANQPTDAINHFRVLKKFIPDLAGLGLLDNLKLPENNDKDLALTCWERNEIENYLVLPECLKNYFLKRQDIFEQHNLDLLQKIINDNTVQAALTDLNHRFWQRTKISDDYLDVIVREYLGKMKMPFALLDKSKYSLLVEYSSANEIPDEVNEKLEALSEAFN